MEVNKKIIQCKHYPITYTLLTKKVKNINLRISNKGEIVVSANAFVPLEKIDEFVTSKITWILDHQKKVLERSAQCVRSEEELMLFGNRLKIKRSVSKYNHVSYDQEYLLVQYKEGSDSEKVIQNFLDKLCKDVFLDVATLTNHTLKDYKLPFPTLKIREMKSKWGSCMPAKQTITLNKKLIHYPLEFIEYVVLHEFVHFIQPNHSKSFYHIIENYMPDYKQRVALVEG